MGFIVFIIAVIIGGFIGYVMAKLRNHDMDIKTLDERQTDDWYNLTMSIAGVKNDVQYLEECLKLKFPNIHNEYMEKYSHLNDNKQ